MPEGSLHCETTMGGFQVLPWMKICSFSDCEQSVSQWEIGEHMGQDRREATIGRTGQAVRKRAIYICLGLYNN